MSFVEASPLQDGRLLIVANGRWTVPNARQIEEELPRILTGSKAASGIELDLSRVDEFDTYGAWLLERLQRDLQSDGKTLKVKGIHSRNKPLLAQVSKTSPMQETPGEDPTDELRFAARMGEFFGRISADVTGFLTMLGAILVAAVRTLRHPGQFRLTSTIYQFDRVCWKALPIVLVVTFIIGVIIAQQGFFHFRRFGADLYVVDMIGFLIMREIGVLLVAIVVAGRSGSSYTAELGSMKMREEIDALKTMGFDPVGVLVLPRVLVLVIGLPVLTFLGSLAALLGAGLVATTYAGMTTELFMDRLNEAISMDHFKVGLIKAPFIGLVIGIIACVEGMRVQGSALSLGRHTTQSVVKSIFMVIMLDGLFALFFSAIEM